MLVRTAVSRISVLPVSDIQPHVSILCLTQAPSPVCTSKWGPRLQIYLRRAVGIRVTHRSDLLVHAYVECIGVCVLLVSSMGVSFTLRRYALIWNATTQMAQYHIQNCLRPSIPNRIYHLHHHWVNDLHNALSISSNMLTASQKSTWDQ